MNCPRDTFVNSSFSMAVRLTMLTRPLHLIGTACGRFALAVCAWPLFSRRSRPPPPAFVHHRWRFNRHRRGRTAVLPAADYWKQDLFLIPYQGVATPAGSGAAIRATVRVDRPRCTWQAISEAKPNVKAFNYCDCRRRRILVRRSDR